MLRGISHEAETLWTRGDATRREASLRRVEPDQVRRVSLSPHFPGTPASSGHSIMFASLRPPRAPLSPLPLAGEGAPAGAGEGPRSDCAEGSVEPACPHPTLSRKRERGRPS